MSAPHTPRVVKCADCALDLDCDAGMLIRAAFTCPLFGKDRSGVELHCLSFMPKVAKRHHTHRDAFESGEGEPT